MESIWNNIGESFGVTDAIDILIVAFIIYKVLQFIKDTRAEQLAKGVLLFILVTVLAQWCHLYTLHWIMSSLVTVGVLALVIIFQPELRRGLEYLGRNKFGNFSFSLEDDEEDTTRIIDAISNAVIAMSRQKTGALIVLERETQLNEIVETGTIIDARIEDQVIGNIFYEGAPLHDGALLIRGNRLHAAGCVLPLTENKDLDKELGTRHRAGIGISENSDALVIIVSEETGTVSVAENGKLTRGFDREELRVLLAENLTPKKEEHRFKKALQTRIDFSGQGKGGASDEK